MMYGSLRAAPRRLQHRLLAARFELDLRLLRSSVNLCRSRARLRRPFAFEGLGVGQLVSLAFRDDLIAAACGADAACWEIAAVEVEPRPRPPQRRRDDLRREVPRPRQSDVALNHREGRVDTVDDDRHA